MNDEMKTHRRPDTQFIVRRNTAVGHLAKILVSDRIHAAGCEFQFKNSAYVVYAKERPFLFISLPD
jgi:hypothetical protein